MKPKRTLIMIKQPQSKAAVRLRHWRGGLG
jgi:hypothetical protein